MAYLVRLIAGALVFAIATAAQAQKIEGPIRLLVGYTPGGASDRAARMVGEALQQRLGATVIVENKTGAGGRIAAQALRTARDNET